MPEVLERTTRWNLPKFAGLTWHQILHRMWREVKRDRVYNRAAELAFWFLLGFFPMLLFATSLSANLVSGSQTTIMRYLRSVLPAGASSLVQGVLKQTQGTGREWIPLILALWSASSATSGLIDALNGIYNLDETRPLWKKQVVAIVLAVGMGVLIMMALTIVIYGTELVQQVAGGSSFLSIWNVAQYLAAAGLVILSLLVVYRYAPDVKEQHWKWLLPGSIVSTGIWLAVSFVFKFYVRHFSTFGLLYGSVGTLIILMIWFYLSGLAILVGGEMNAVLEAAAADRKVPGAKEPGEKEAEQ